MSEGRAWQPVDATNCDREPIHIPGRIQGHGVLLAIKEPELSIIQVSQNSSLLGPEASELLGRNLDSLLTARQLEHLRNHLRRDDLERTPLHIFTGKVGSREADFCVVAHRTDDSLVLELERLAPHQAPPSDVQSIVKSTVSRFQTTASIRDFSQTAAEQVRKLSGFDRVMIYQFLEDGSGVVIAEDRRADVEPFLDLHYPASDIPQQARRLYLLNWLRLIPDVNYQPVDLVPAANPSTGKPLDMSYAALRSVSPIHIEYLKNMGVAASMSISIIENNQLWGLIACHHYSPQYLSFDVRAGCELLGQIFSLQIAAKEETDDKDYKWKISRTLEGFVEQMSKEEHFTDGLVKHNPNLLDFVEATGAALFVDGQCTLLGQTPSEREVRHLAAWLVESVEQEFFSTNALPSLYPPAEGFKDVGCGLLVVSLSRGMQNYAMWFRPEDIQTVKWGGNPNKPVTAAEDEVQLLLSPRKSFELWKETVRLKSLPWKKAETDAAQRLRRAVSQIVLRKTEQLAELNFELKRSNGELDAFTYMASHDLKEPLRGIHNFSQFLSEGYADQLDAEGQTKLQTLMRLAGRMEGMIDSLLHYSRVGQLELSLKETNLDEVVREVVQLLTTRLEEAGTSLRIPRPLPTIKCDPVRVEEIFTNLLTNAIKYNDKAERWIEIGYINPQNGEATPAEATHQDSRDERLVFYVRDNGIGIREKQIEQTFRLFRRLHGRDHFGGGTGAGLTIVKRVVERHGGRIWVESAYGEGTTFYFTLQE